jgi:hypothetical protein
VISETNKLALLKIWYKENLKKFSFFIFFFICGSRDTYKKLKYMACLDQLRLVRGLVRGLAKKLAHLLAPDRMN